VILGRRAHDDIVAHAREDAPAECCGLLVGAGESVTESVRTRNLSANPNRFEIDPADHIRVRRECRARGVDVLGFYHSHPRSAAVPSASDLVEARYPNHLYLIVSVRSDRAEVRVYRLENDGFLEVSWKLEPALQIADAGADVDDDGR
jgi:proteasome lid subunit RPN8/RPN11